MAWCGRFGSFWLLATALILHTPMDIAVSDDAPASETTTNSSVDGTDDHQEVPASVPSPISTRLSKEAPSGTEDLLAIEKQLRSVVDGMLAATVCVQVGDTQGSGVIVTDDGYILTAAHVIAAPGRELSVILADGRRVIARSLGVNTVADVGLVKISNAGTYPFAKLSSATAIETGAWCVALGHPGGYEHGRPPVVRLGRLVSIRKSIYQSDSTLVGGDSGGPLFDLDGHVIGIHSRIGAPTSLNLHTPISVITKNWTRLAASERIGARSVPRKVLLGINGEDDETGARLTAVFPKWPADLAGLIPGDVVTSFDGNKVTGFDDLRQKILEKAAGDAVRIVILRNGETLEKNAVLITQP